jgi:hypothetical protein
LSSREADGRAGACATPPLAYYEAVPYLLVMESIERDGEWVRRAEYPELGCLAEAASAVEAFDKLEHERRRVLQRLLEQGVPIPVPRPPLRGSLRTTSAPPRGACGEVPNRRPS